MRTRPIRLIAWSSLLEIQRQKDVYVLFILTGLYLLYVLAAAIRGFGRTAMEQEESSRFLLGLGLQAAFFLSAVLTATTAGRQLTKEWEDRTIYPLLAKPISRIEALVGKWFAVVVAGVTVMLTLSLVTVGLVLAVSPNVPTWDYFMLTEALIGQGLALAVLAGCVLTFSLWTPRPLAILLGMVLYACSGIFQEMIRKRLADEEVGVVRWVVDYLPNFSLLDQSERFLEGSPSLDLPEMLALIYYGLTFTGFFLALAGFSFRRKRL